jgi:hypothetical protein
MPGRNVLQALPQKQNGVSAFFRDAVWRSIRIVHGLMILPTAWSSHTLHRQRVSGGGISVAQRLLKRSFPRRVRLATGGPMRTNHVVVVSLGVLVLLLNSRSSHAQSAAPIQEGYIHLKADNGSTSPVGIVLFGFENDGVVVSEAGVPPTSPARSGILFVEMDRQVHTGIALANPGDQNAIVSYSFNDNSGRRMSAGLATLPAHHQTEWFFNERPFAIQPPLVGTFTFTSSAPVSAVGLRTTVSGRNETLKTTLPVWSPGAGSGGTELLIPQLENSANWDKEVVLVNPGATPLTGTVQFLGHESEALSTHPIRVIVDDVSGTSFDYVIPPRGVFEMRPQPSHSKMTITSARIHPGAKSSTPRCLGILSYAKHGSTVAMVGISALPEAKTLRMYVESSNVFGQPDSTQSILSASNASSSASVVRFEISSLDGTATGLFTSVEIPAGGQMTRLLSDLFPKLGSPFKGVLRVSASSPVSLAGLRVRYNKHGNLLLAVTPPYDETTESLTELDFPYFINGGGYSTQLILMSTGSAHNGSLWLFSQDGVSLPASILKQNP